MTLTSQERFVLNSFDFEQCGLAVEWGYNKATLLIFPVPLKAARNLSLFHEGEHNELKYNNIVEKVLWVLSFIKCIHEIIHIFPNVTSNYLLMTQISNGLQLGLFRNQNFSTQ